MVDYSNEAKVAADYALSEALGAALLAGLDVEVALPGTAFAYRGEWVRKVDLVTGVVTEGWVYE